ncbi:MAG: tripartite tricarboxylate transporter permease [candidate division NC10 bacterium]|nr:tripartite tricarboxylate transporter permease [candidate division NC10 bacterium]
MDLFHNLYNGFAIALTFQNIMYCSFGVFFGQIIGVLPGIGAPTAIALLLPLTFSVDPTSAIIMFAGIYYGVAYGGTITSVLINVPGESSTVMTCLDGYQMALQGRAGAALSVAAIGSWIAGTASVVLLMAFAPALATFALRFGPAEFFALTMMAFGLLTVFGEENPFKVIISTMLGLLLSTIGLDVVSGMPRFAFGVPQLLGGFDFIVIICGMFGVTEVFNSIENPEDEGEVLKGKLHLRDMFLTWEDWVASRWAILRGSVIGFFIGMIPAGGITTASFIAYLAEKRYSKHPERFGKGAIEGVAAPESANNAASISGFAPLLALGIPGSATTAVMLAGFMMWGIRPGPLLFMQHANLVWGLIASMYVGNFLLLLMNIFMIPVFVAMLRVPYSIMMGFIVVFATVGAFSVNNNLFDVWMMLGFALMAYAMIKLKYPLVPLILALVLGKLSENSLRQALMLSGGSMAIFVTHPISAFFMGAAFLAYMTPVMRWYLKRRRAKVVPA